VKRPAVFLDRDGTLIRDWHYVGRPEDVELLPGVAAAVRRLNDAGWLVVVVTNQSGIARGMFTEADYERVRSHMEKLLSAAGARVDESYMCPHHPEFTGPCECRKPGTLLFRRAAKDHDLDMARSWFIGDKLRDILPATTVGGHGVLVPNERTTAKEITDARARFAVAASLDEAVSQVIESAQ
jgi:D-glycero-D-manno-heptose 1,7-bisphosphate phosphatase